MNPIIINKALSASLREINHGPRHEEDIQAFNKINLKLSAIIKMSALFQQSLSLKKIQSIWPHFSEIRTLLVPTENSVNKSVCLMNFINVQTRCLFHMPTKLLESDQMPGTEIDAALTAITQCLATTRDDIALLSTPQMRQYFTDDIWSDIHAYRNNCRHVELLCHFVKATIDSRRADVDFIPEGIDSSEEIRITFSEASLLTNKLYQRIVSQHQTESTSTLRWLTSGIAHLFGLSGSSIFADEVCLTSECKSVSDAVDVHLQKSLKAVDARLALAIAAKKLADEDMGLTPESKLMYLQQMHSRFSCVGMWQAPLISMHMVKATMWLAHDCIGKIRVADEDFGADLQNICRSSYDLMSHVNRIVNTANSVFLSHAPATERVRLGLGESVISNENAISRFKQLGNCCEASAKRYDAFVNMLSNFDFIRDEVKISFANTAAELRRMRLTIISELERRGYVAPELPKMPIPQRKKIQQGLAIKKKSKPIPTPTPKNASSKNIKDPQQSTEGMASSIPTDQSDKLDDAGDDLLIPEYFGMHFKSVNNENKMQLLEKEAASYQLKLAFEKKRIEGMLEHPDAWRTQTMDQIEANAVEQNMALDLHGLYADFTISRLQALAKLQLSDDDESRIQQNIQDIKESHTRLVIDVSKQQFPNPRAIRNMVKVEQIAEWKMTKERMKYSDPKTEETNLYDVIQVSRKEGKSEVAWFEAHAHYTEHVGQKNYIKNAIHLKHISQATKGRRHEIETGENIKRWKLSQQDFRELFIR